MLLLHSRWRCKQETWVVALMACVGTFLVLPCGDRYFRLWNRWLALLKWERSVVARVLGIMQHSSVAAAFRTWVHNISDAQQAEEARQIAREYADSLTLSSFLLKRMENHRRDITKDTLNTLTLLTKTSLDAGQDVGTCGVLLLPERVPFQ